MDRLLQVIIDMVGRFGGAVTPPTIPFDKLYSMMDVLMPYLNKANSIFPVDDILFIFVILGGIRIVLIVLWSIKFIRSMLPF